MIPEQKLKKKKNVTANHFNPKVFYPVFTFLFDHRWFFSLRTSFAGVVQSNSCCGKVATAREHYYFLECPFFSFSQNVTIFVLKKERLFHLSYKEEYVCSRCDFNVTFARFVCNKTNYFYRLLRRELIRFNDFARKTARFVYNNEENYALTSIIVPSRLDSTCIFFFIVG